MTMTTEAEKIRKAAYRILEPGAWTQKTMARDASGAPTHSASQTACQWCALGALAREGIGLGARLLVDDSVSDYSITGLNDARRTKAEDMATLLLIAAEMLEDES